MRRPIDAVRVYSIALRFCLAKPNRLGRIPWVSVFSYQDRNFKVLFITLKLLFYANKFEWLLLKV
ncbi:hypothetical protein F0T03_21190 [Yersinia canariae]|uniref:Uncharacterized protein n=1 Tax=Yersinia canariae TaxID=2607663 RepID=A0A857F3U2_9GAMM|nr:hypothetical protein F0T03_21190 [Yersinia canariae]